MKMAVRNLFFPMEPLHFVERSPVFEAKNNLFLVIRECFTVIVSFSVFCLSFASSSLLKFDLATTLIPAVMHRRKDSLSLPFS